MKREMIEIGSTIRVENGPARKTAIATGKLLDDKVTATHYYARRKVPALYQINEDGTQGALIEPEKTIPGGKDAMGKEIVLDEPMTYLDYRGPWVWYIYQLGQMGIDAEGRPLKPDKVEDLQSKAAWKAKAVGAARTEERWIPVGVETSKAAALALANGLAGEAY